VRARKLRKEIRSVYHIQEESSTMLMPPSRKKMVFRSPLNRRWPIYCSIFLLSACALAYEILLMRLFSIIQWHHFAYMVIGLALLGYGISGSVISIWQMTLLRLFD
jgi:hypothetical protein